MSGATATPAPAPIANGKPAKLAQAPKAPAAKKTNPNKATGVPAIGKRIQFVKLGDPVVKSLELKELSFDKKLQHRNKLHDDSDGGAVETYAEAIMDGAEMPPLEGVDDGKTVWIFDGFQRGGAFAKCFKSAKWTGAKKIRVNVRKGTFNDALLLSLKSNSENSVIPRTRDDRRRSVFALLDNAELLKLVLEKSVGKGGAHRGIADVCGVSPGTAVNALADRGLKVQGDKLVPAGPKKEKSKKDDDGSGKNDDPPAKPLTAAEQKKANDAAFAAMKQQNHMDHLKECKKIVGRLGALMAAFVTHDEHSTEIRTLMDKHGLSISDEFDTRAVKEGKSFTPYYEILELWPVAQKLGNFIADAIKSAEAVPAGKGTEGTTPKTK